MTTTSPSIVFSNSTDASFRAWGSAIRDNLLAVGLVATGDTGQINWTTVLTPTSTSMSRGYEMYRLNDAVQGSAPVFIKVEYGAGGSTGFPSLWITIGRSTDGAGNITSALVQPIRQMQNNTANPPAVVQCFFSGDGSYLNVILTGHMGFLISIERTRNADGTPNGDGLLFASRTASAVTYNLSVMSFLNNYVSNTGIDSAAVPGAAFGTTNADGNTSFFPRLVMLPKKEYDLALMFAYANDVVDLTNYTLDNCGAPHNYLAWKTPAPFAAAIGGTYATLVRFE